MTRHRIVLTTTELRPGGAERCLVDLALGLDRTRYEPVVYILSPPPAPPQDVLHRQLENAGVPTHFLDARRPSQLPRIVAAFRRRLMIDRPVLIQSFLYHAHVVSALATIGFTRRSRPRVVAGLRVGRQSQMRSFVRRRLGRFTDGYVCVSDDVAGEFRGVLESEKLHVIPTGINVSVYQNRSYPEFLAGLGVPTNRRVLLMLGRGDSQKGADWLLSGAGRMLRDLPDHDLLLVGSGMKQARLYACVALATAGVAQRVHACDWFPNVVGLMQASDMLLLPSRWEGMPRVLLEAMACGLPIVACDVQGVRQALGELASVQIVPPADLEAFARQVTWLVHEQQLHAVGQRNVARVAAHFSLAAMVHAYEALYESLLADDKR